MVPLIENLPDETVKQALKMHKKRDWKVNIWARPTEQMSLETEGGDQTVNEDQSEQRVDENKLNHLAPGVLTLENWGFTHFMLVYVCQAAYSHSQLTSLPLIHLQTVCQKVTSLKMHIFATFPTTFAWKNDLLIKINVIFLSIN